MTTLDRFAAVLAAGTERLSSLSPQVAALRSKPGA